MESLQSKFARRSVRPVVVIGAIAFLVTCGVVACGRSLQKYSLRESLESDTPVLDLNVVYFDVTGKRFGAPASQPVKVAEGSTAEGGCAEVAGGDLKRTSPPQNARYGEPPPAPCPMAATWNVHRHPVAVSLFVRNGDAVMDWYESNAAFGGFRDSPLWKGFTEAVAVVLKVRGVDLALPTLPLTDWSGQFLRPLLKEVVRADFALHYDLIHGAGGFVLSFDKAKTSLVAQALPLLVKHLGSAAYNVTNGAPVGPDGIEVDNAVIQLRIQGKKLFLTQRGSRVYVATALEGLLNVTADPAMLVPPASELMPAATAIAVVRAEAFFDKLLPVLVGAPVAPVTIGLSLSGTESMVSDALVPSGNYVAALAKSPFEGVLAAVPRDSLGALLTSVKIPLGTPVAEWSFANAAKETNGGMALVWDITGEDSSFHFGIAAVAPPQSNAAVSPSTSEGDKDGEDAGQEEEGDDGLSAFLSDDAVSSTCAGGSVWIAASSDVLLSRMQEACDKKSLSVLDMKGMDAKKILSQQLAVLFNTKIAVKELYRLGGGATFSTEEERAAEVLAQKKLLQDTDDLAAKLPILGLAGGIQETSPHLSLHGFSAANGGA